MPKKVTPAPLTLNRAGEKVSPEGAAWLAFDIETVLDASVEAPGMRWSVGPDGIGSTVEEFPSPPQCQVVSIAGCAMDETLMPQQLILFGRGMPEHAQVWDFTRYTKDSSSLGWVTFNGRGFDVPVLLARLMRHGWPLPTYFEGRRGGLRYRYADPDRGKHIDLCDQLADYGGGRKASFKHYCQSFGLPGKLEADGSSVAAWYAAGEQEKIDWYCLFDAVQNAFFFQRFMLLCGRIGRTYYKDLVKSTVARFEATPGFGPLVAAIDRPKLFLEEV